MLRLGGFSLWKFGSWTKRRSEWPDGFGGPESGTRRTSPAVRYLSDSRFTVVSLAVISISTELLKLDRHSVPAAVYRPLLSHWNYQWYFDAND